MKLEKWFTDREMERTIKKEFSEAHSIEDFPNSNLL